MIYKIVIRVQFFFFFGKLMKSTPLSPNLYMYIYFFFIKVNSEYNESYGKLNE